MKTNKFFKNSHFKIYDSIIPLFRLITTLIFMVLILLNQPGNMTWNILFISAYLAYAFALLFSRKLRYYIVYKKPVVIGLCESALISYGITVTGGVKSYLYLSYILVIIFYAIVHTKKELITITGFICGVYLILTVVINGQLTVESAFKLVYIASIAVFTGLLSGKIKKYNSDVALKDQLTGLYNRNFLFGELESLLSDKECAGKIFSMLVIDLNDFKIINDTYGHLAGDQTLKEVAILLNRILEPEPLATITRYGGDEFVVLLPDVDAEKADSLRKILYQEMKLLFQERISFSIGIATYPEDGTNEKILFSVADQEMYEEKLRIKNNKTAV